ncbi:MAG TPA: heavy-metal-associated domain-containing protein [Candidatus Mediterraneibacter avicola]|nr:heavy-metal-associated domain-containing protein [Candidatus Mediterraneibacter avicola]
MVNIIVIIILMILIGGAVAYIIKAKKSGVKCIGCPAGGSCPGSGKMPKKKLAGRVIGRKTIKISGMHCAHCAVDVANALNQIDGAAAKVSLKDSSAEVSLDREIDKDELIHAVEKAGFKVVSIL